MNFLKKEEFTEYKDQFYSDLSQQDSFWKNLTYFRLILVAKMQQFPNIEKIIKIKFTF